MYDRGGDADDDDNGRALFPPQLEDGGTPDDDESITVVPPTFLDFNSCLYSEIRRRLPSTTHVRFGRGLNDMAESLVLQMKVKQSLPSVILLY